LPHDSSAQNSIAGTDVEENLVLIEDLCELMTDGSLCAMGGLTPRPVRSAIKHFPADFRRNVPLPMPTFGAK
jgi:formate dehydrogenase iron-sulfur subunit